MTRRALLIMAKRPAAGRTKTRLHPPLSLAQAAELYRGFLLDVIDRVRQLDGVDPGIAFGPVDSAEYFAQLAPDFIRVPQRGDTLGERLDTVLSSLLNSGYDQVAAINSDSPTLPRSYLQQAFAQLDDPTIDAVFGPCEDGGYYLIGIKQPQPRLVRDVQMSTPAVLADTLAIARAHNIRTALLPSWYDVDEVSELKRLQNELARNPALAPYTAKILRETPLRAILY